MSLPKSGAVETKAPSYDALVHLVAKPHPAGEFGAGRIHYYSYDIFYHNEKIVENSIDPAHDSARALCALGLSGWAAIKDERGMIRYRINIEKAAQYRVSDNRRGFARIKWENENGNE